jgi:serine/threonine-protein kinase
VTGVPEGLEQVVMKCLAKKRDDRFTDVGELAKALVPYGSGTWIHSAERVQATLARALLEDMSSGTRIRNSAAGSSERIAIPSAPGRRLDSMQPELHGTASTVARRFSVFESRRSWVLAGIVVPAILGLGLALVGFVTFRNKEAALGAEGDPTSRAEPPAAVVDPVPAPAATTVVSPIGVQTASVENDLPPTMHGTVLGASPMPPAAVASTAAVRAGKPASLATSRPVATAPRPVAKSTPVPSAKALPAGLPQTRSGQ